MPIVDFLILAQLIKFLIIILFDLNFLPGFISLDHHISTILILTNSDGVFPLNSNVKVDNKQKDFHLHFEMHLVRRLDVGWVMRMQFKSNFHLHFDSRYESIDELNKRNRPTQFSIQVPLRDD